MMPRAEPVEAHIIATRPGLEAALGEPESLWLVDQFARTPGVDSSRLAADLCEIEMDSGGLLSGRLSQAAERIADLFKGQRRSLVGVEQAGIDLQALIVQCPEGEASGVLVTVERTESTGSALRVQLPSIGGGPAHDMSLAVEDQFEVLIPGSSASVVYSVAGIWEHWEVETRTGEIVRYPKLASVDVGQAVVKTEQGPKTRPISWGASSMTTKFDLSDGVMASRTLRIDSGEELDATAGIQVLGFGFELKARMRREYSLSTRYRFSPGHRYRADYFQSVGAWWASTE